MELELVEWKVDLVLYYRKSLACACLDSNLNLPTAQLDHIKTMINNLLPEMGGIFKSNYVLQPKR